MRAQCKVCGAELIWALGKSGNKIPLEWPSQKRYVRVDFADSDPIVSLRDTYLEHVCKGKQA